MLIQQPETASILPGRIISNKDYHADTSRISKSGLDLINKSPLHFWDAKLNPARKKIEDTEALLIGRAWHVATLEYSNFNTEFAVSPGFNRRTKEGKEDYEFFAKSVAGKEVIDLDQYQLVMAMREATLANPVAKALLASGLVENTYTWTDQETGIECKCRPDFLNNNRLCVDLKSTNDASPEAFGRSANEFRYPVQGAYYSDGLEANGIQLDGFVFIAVEKKPPYAVACYYLDARGFDLGRKLYKTNLRTYAECKATNTWPGYSDIITPLQLPGWAFK